MSDLKNWIRSLRRRESLAFFASTLACLLFFASSTANAVLVTGDPSADSGWAAAGNVLDVGNYVLGNANFGFNMYSSAFTADSALATAIGSGWNAGDTILALGGKRQATDGVSAGWGLSFTGAAVNSNLTTSARIVAKFGTSIANSVTPSTIRPDSGNGLGSFSGGNLGDGSILLGTPNTGGFFTAANQGLFLTFLNDQRYSGGNVATISNGFGRIIYELGGDNLLSSWEVLLDTTLLAASFSNVPTAGALSVLTEQRGAGNVTDGLVAVTAVPEASAFLFGSVACCLVGLTVFCRKFKLAGAPRE